MLTYFVELEAGPLDALFARPEVLDGLARSSAAVSMAMLDLDPRRAAVVRALGARGIPTTAWLVLSAEDGYWLTADNSPLAGARYREVKAWADARDLAIERYGLDVEIPMHDASSLVRSPVATLRRLFLARRSRKRVDQARARYAELVAEIRRDGAAVETYQFPFIVDERRVGSTLLQRMLGLVDVAADREVLMLYRSTVPGPVGRTLVDAYGCDADAIGVGITGGGVEFLVDAFAARELDLPSLLVDLRRARRYTDHLYVFSLEGCVDKGYFEALTRSDLATPPRSRPAQAAAPARALLRAALRAESLFDTLGRR